MKYPAEVFDQMQLLFELNGFNDHQMHCVLRFERSLKIELLQKAVLATIAANPILGARFVRGPKPHWSSIAAEEYGRAICSVRSATEFERFLAASVDEGVGPQIRVCILDALPFAVAFKMNHMVCDAADFKTYLYLLADTYCALIEDADYRPAARTGDRSLDGVLRRFSPGVKLKSLLFESRQNNLTGDVRFPLSEEGEAQPFILTRTLSRARTQALKRYGKQRGATLNDIVLTALYRCLFRKLGLGPGSALCVPVMVDMRRYLDDRAEFSPLTNLSSTVTTTATCRPGEPFAETLAAVKAVMDDRKATNLGLNGFIKLAMLYRILGDRATNRLLRSMLKNPYLCMTNVGILDAKRLVFGDLCPQDAYLCGSVKYRPYFQLAMSSYNGAMTLSTNLAGTAGDRSELSAFLAEVDAELEIPAQLCPGDLRVRRWNSGHPGDCCRRVRVEPSVPQPDSPLPVTSSREPEWAPEARACYRDVVQLLDSAGVPFAVGGGFAFHRHTGIWRTTKDLDLFLAPGDVGRGLDVLHRQGFETWIEDPIWLAKARRDGFFVDLISGVGNATLPVEPSWLGNSIDARILDIVCKVLGAEEMIAAKTFVTRRERFDGADIAHLVKACGAQLDWERLAGLVRPYEQMLYWHLVLFAFIYPEHTGVVPEPVWRGLTARFQQQLGPRSEREPFRGALIDPKMFAIDVNEWGERDLYAELSAAYPARLDAGSRE